MDLIDKFNKLNNVDYSPNLEYFSRLFIIREIAKTQSDKDAYFAECGVYAGMSMFFSADHCKTKFIGIDSFDGVSQPGPKDSDYFKKHDIKAPIEVAKNNLKEFKNIELIKGWIPEVFNEIKTSKYSFVHIDVDLYEPTIKSINYFWDKIISGGILICDDYGSSKTIGAKRAMNDFFNNKNIIELTTGQALVFKI